MTTLQRKGQVGSLFPVINVEQISSNQVQFTDITPDFSDLYAGGFGHVNPSIDDVLYVSIVLSVGGQLYEVKKTFDKVSRKVVLDATDIPFRPASTASADCDHCNAPSLVIDCDGYWQAFPSGCLRIEYSLQFFDYNLGQISCSNKAIHDLVLYYPEYRDMIDKFNKFPFNIGSCKPYKSEVEREKAMQELILAWTKLNNLSVYSGCNCACVEGQLKAIRSFLNMESEDGCNNCK